MDNPSISEVVKHVIQSNRPHLSTELGPSDEELARIERETLPMTEFSTPDELESIWQPTAQGHELPLTPPDDFVVAQREIGAELAARLLRSVTGQVES